MGVSVVADDVDRQRAGAGGPRAPLGPPHAHDSRADAGLVPGLDADRAIHGDRRVLDHRPGIGMDVVVAQGDAHPGPLEPHADGPGDRRDA